MRMRSRLHKLIISGALFCTAALLHAQNIPYPEIPRLASRDFLFAQYQDDVQNAGKAIQRGSAPVPGFYSYRAQKGDTVFSVSARCSIPQETLASVNHLENAFAVLEGRQLILPTAAGLYIALKPQNQIEILLANEHSVEVNAQQPPVCIINGEKFYFLRNARFSPEERAFFLDDGMALPLSQYVLTSPFGMRVSPISGKWKFHRGIDMAAPTGTPVSACKTGKVREAVSNDYTYGNYIVVEHDGGMTSTYAHLSKLLVKPGETVRKGQVIGKVGVTGLTTGPHLHFEVTLNGKSQNPQEYLKKQ